MGFAFSDHVALLAEFLAARQTIAHSLERELFGARGKALAEEGERESIDAAFSACFFELRTLSPNLSPLRGQLQAAHLADGFEPPRQDAYSRELDPVELVLRACHDWGSGRWPGRNGRLVYAQNLHAVFMLRQLEHLSLRIWDDGADRAAERLQQIQHLLDVLNAGGQSRPQVRFVRDARWLIQTAQGPLTRHAEPYFRTARNISALSEDVRLEIHKAGAVLAGGHLRSQLRRLSRHTGWAFDDPQLVALTRSSNSMDMALLVGDLVPLLDAYSAACARQDSVTRMALADAILQGLSADPELLLTRLDLLDPSTMIEQLFVERGPAGALSCSTAGKEYRERLARYGELLGRTAALLQQDSQALDPVHAAYSPFAIVYGFCTDLFSNMVLSTLRSSRSPDLSLEDLFLSRGRFDEKRARAAAWERLPKGEGEPDPFEYSIAWAEHMHGRLARALEARAARPGAPNASSVRTCRL
jgi:hypothetical protein